MRLFSLGLRPKPRAIPKGSSPDKLARRVALLLLFVCVSIAWPARAETFAISPSPTRADTGGHISFVASGGSGTGYVFTLVSAPSGGSITSAGEYTAGPLGGVVDVVHGVDSSGDSADANVDVISTLAITGASSVATSSTETLVASGGSGVYTWSLSSAPSGGTISATGLYTAGIHDGTDVVLLADAAGNRTTFSIDVSSGLALTPAAPRVAPLTSIAFVASGGSGSGYTFTLATNASGATLSAAGVYVAGATAGVTDVVELTDGNGNTVTTAITVVPITITPSNASVVAGETRAFVAAGGSGGGYVWSLSTNASGGSVNDLGIYTAGLLAGVDDILSVRDALGNVSTARITVAGPKIAPTNPSVAPKGRLGFAASGGSGGYRWSFVTNESGATLNDFGIYVAGAIAGTTDIVQVSDSRGNTSTVNVNVTGIGPTITPTTPSVAIGATQGFVASGGAGRGYTWTLTRSASGGKITSFGAYTAGPKAGTDTVEVVDANGAKTTTTITVTSGLAIAPTAPTVYQGTTFGFVAHGGSGEGYRWAIEMNNSGAAITALGVYTAGTTDAGANVTDSVRVTDSEGNTATESVTVLPPPPDIPQADGGLVFGASGAPADASCNASSHPASSGFGLVLTALGLILMVRRRRN